MSNSAGLKYKLGKRLKLSAVGGPKSPKNDDKSIDKMKRGGKGNEEEHGGKYKKQGKLERGRNKFLDVGIFHRKALSTGSGYSRKGEKRSEKRSVEEKSRTAAASDGKHTSAKRRKSKDVELFNGNPLSAKGRKFNGEKSVKDWESGKFSGSVEGKARSRARSKAIAVDRKDSAERFEGAGEESSKVKHVKTKLNTGKHVEKRQRGNDGKSFDKSLKEKVSHRKGSDDDSVVTEELPRKRKRVIRIDPHDISNKRIDNSIPTNG